MSDSNREVVEKLDAICKLVYMQTKPHVEQLKSTLIKTEKQQKIYDTLDGKKTIEQIAKEAGYSDPRPLKGLLPEWEKKGLILSLGKKANKRYVNIENLIT
jgi:hypothetical protein